METPMADRPGEAQVNTWWYAWPYSRLFRTLKLALNPTHVLLALACVLLVYLGGRLLDAIWGERNGVVISAEGESEIEAYARGFGGEWGEATAQARRERETRALVLSAKAADARGAENLLRTSSAGALVRDAAFRTELGSLRGLIATRLTGALAAVDANQTLSSADRRKRREQFRRDADDLRIGLSDSDLPLRPDSEVLAAAADRLLRGDPNIAPAEASENVARMRKAVEIQAWLAASAAMRPRGPFIEFVAFQSQCFAGAIRGVCALHWGAGEGALDPEPSLLGSIASSARGAMWLVTRRPWFAIVFGLMTIAIGAFFGGAIARSAAMQSARDEEVSLTRALRYAREKYAAFAVTPLIPLGLAMLILILMFIGGLVGAIPYVGELFAGVAFPLAILGGFALAAVVLAGILGFHLLWPAVAVEGSDSFDAFSRACGYVGQRLWSLGLYVITLLVYGGLAFVVVRVVAMFTLKLTHTGVKLGMNLATAAHTDGIGKLDAIWRMPSWSELPLLPSTGRADFWGKFGNAPLDGSETLTMWLIMLWVFLVVGGVVAFAFSFFCCGSTQIYFLLRKEVDATDWTEICEDGGEQGLAPATSAGEVGAATTPGAPPEEAKGTPLPVAGTSTVPPAG
jgi:hypothetical protein